ncbi:MULTISPECIES: hypothetical protein [Emticicia]|uniref:hypothetical protein n=1 Tax=Emticicia TaxID=312278 RepID=UPI0012E960F1|nr:MULTISPECIES: hypothetical protein [Emticicia]
MIKLQSWNWLNLIFILLFLCSSCSKKDNIVSPINNLGILEIKDDYLSLHLKYDTLKNVYSISKYFEDNVVPSYNKRNNELIQFGQYKNFKYDSKGRLSQFDDISIQYDLNNNIVKLIQSNKKYQQYFKFEYDSNSNLVKMITTENVYGFEGKESTFFSTQFDNTMNPYYNLPTEIKVYLLTYGLFAKSPMSFSPIILFSKNNFSTISGGEQTKNSGRTINQRVISNFQTKPNLLTRVENKNNFNLTDTLKVTYFK